MYKRQLKKQGMLALTFVDPSAYDEIREDDKITIFGLKEFAPEKYLTLEVNHSDGSFFKTELKHTFSPMQIEWFKAGSALNLIASG